MRHALRRVTCHINPCLIGETQMDGDDLFVVIYLFIFGFCLGSPLSSNMASRHPAQCYVGVGKKIIVLKKSNRTDGFF